MFFRKSKGKQFLSSFLVFILVLTLLPISAFALTTGDEVRISVVNTYVDDSGNYTEKISDDDEDKLTDKFDNSTRLTENKIDTYVYSSDMSEDERDGSVVPYFLDEANRKWELYNVSVANGRKIDDPGTQHNLLCKSDISEASNSVDYVVDTSEISLEPYTTKSSSYYFIWYSWKLAEGEDGEVTSYQVSYDLNLPSELSDSKTLFPVYRVDDRENMDVLSEDGQLYVVEDAVEALSGSVYENVPFTVADFSYTLYVDFLVFDEDSYYDFDGWYIEGDEDTLYQTGDVLKADDSLAGNNGTISFKAKWTKIPPLDVSEETKWEDLGKLAARPPILSADTRNVADNVLITQWTDTDANLSGDRKSGETVMLDEDRTIYYQMAATVNSALYSSYFSPASMPFEDFMTFTLSLDVDDKLEFVDGESDQATLTFNSPIFKVTETNIENANFSEYPDKNGDSTITFDPDNIPDGNVITVTVKWNEKVENNDITPSGTMTLSGFAFKLKGGTASKDMVISTSGNITGSLDLKKPNGINQRYYYQTVLNLLNSNFYGYQEAFGGDASDPEAYVHAMQFTDLVISNYDLSQDTKAVLDDNTVTAAVVQSEPVKVTPANITVYEGGTGGYDAVVDGTETTSSNSLPHPMFRITAPDGVDPEDLTFTNGGKSWTVIPDGNDYYHFSEEEGQDKVRVTYSYTDASGEKHTVTDDAFDPATMGDVYGKLTIALYSGENDLSQVTAKTEDGKVYRLEVGTGTLTVRAVQENDATSDVISSEDEGSAGSFDEDGVYTGEIQSGNAVAVAPAGTTYTLNNTGVELPDDAIPSLLFDSIIEDKDSTARTDALKEQASEWLDANRLATGGTRHYEAKYLDLVDANNGNAWISSSKGTDIYWGYPEGTDRNTNFTLLHFNGLHRDGENSGYDEADIAAVTPDKITIEKLDNGIKFHVDSGGFSPFVLVWTEASAPGPDPTPDPDPEPTPDPDEPGIADPDDTGVADWLNTKDHEVFLNGYPDGSFGPDRSMTRAEVAAMFSNLLLDKNVPITTSFSDVAEDAWYADAVNMLASLDMIAGYEDGTFRPDAPITRAEFTAIAMRFADAAPEGENIFSDVHAGDWFYDVVVGSIQYGWIGGYEDGTFRPQNTITRAEVTAITNRMLGRVADEAFIDAADELRSFSDLSDAHWAYYSIMEATNAHDYTISDGVEEWEALH